MVDPPLAVEFGDTDPQGGVEQETDQRTLELFEVLAVNNRSSPGPALAEVGEIVTITGREPPQPNSKRAMAAQNKI